MAMYSAYLPPDENRRGLSERFRLLRDAKAPLALIFPPLWLAWHGLWLELLAYAVAALAIGMLAFWQPSPAFLYLSGLPGLYLLLEGNELIRRKYERSGWNFAGVVEGQTQEEAEIRFLLKDEDAADVKAPITIARTPSAQLTPRKTPTSLFPE
ncbi:MAG: DUF2628 domain-containing protein [Pseudomonadota bacterium]